MKKPAFFLVGGALAIVGILFLLKPNQVAHDGILDKLGLPTKKDSVSLSNSLVYRIPTDSFAFFWQSATPALQKLIDSPWGNQQNLSAIYKRLGMDELTDKWKNNGFDISYPFSKNAIQELVIFASPASNSGTEATKGSSDLPFSIGALAKSDSSEKTETIISSFVEWLSKNNSVKVEKGSTDGISTYVLRPTNKEALNNIPKQIAPGISPEFSIDANDITIYLGQKDSLMAVASDKQNLISLLGEKYPPAPPQLITTKEFASHQYNAANSDQRLAFVYTDLVALESFANSFSIDEGTSAETSANIDAVTSASMLMTMNATPQWEAIIKYSDTNPTLKKTLAKFENSTISENMRNALANTPVMFVSVDAHNLAKLPSRLGNTSPVKLDFLKGLKRIGVSLEVAPIGQSLLPIPNFSILFDSDNPEQIENELSNLITQYGSATMQGMPGANAAWQDEVIEGNKVKHKITGPGINIYLTHKDNLVILCNSQNMLISSLKSINSKASPFIKGLSADARQSFEKDSSVIYIYTNYIQLAELLKNLRGVLQMFAAQNPEIADFMSDKKLDELRQLKSMFISVKHLPEDRQIRMRAAYSAS